MAEQGPLSFRTVSSPRPQWTSTSSFPSPVGPSEQIDLSWRPHPPTPTHLKWTILLGEFYFYFFTSLPTILKRLEVIDLACYFVVPN